MIRLNADIIRELYPNVVSIYDNPDGTRESYDSDGNLVDVDYEKVNKEYDSKQYQRDRAEAYPELKEQLDLLWHAIDDGKFNVKSKDTDFYKKLKAVKDANPKPE